MAVITQKKLSIKCFLADRKKDICIEHTTIKYLYTKLLLLSIAHVKSQTFFPTLTFESTTRVPIAKLTIRG